jgi:hypothetical protein
MGRKVTPNERELLNETNRDEVQRPGLLGMDAGRHPAA